MMVTNVQNLVNVDSKATTNDFNPAKVQEPLKKAEEIFKNFGTATTAEKKQLVEHLGTAYSALYLGIKSDGAIPSGLEHEAARIFFIYAETFYGEDYESSRQLFQLSLSIQFVAMKALKSMPSLKGFTSLEMIPKFFVDQEKAFREADQKKEADKKQGSDQAKPFKDLDDLLFKVEQRRLVDTILKSSDPLFTARTIRRLEAPYQNLKFFQKSEYAPLLQKLYGLAMELFITIGTPESNWEAGQFLYNTAPDLESWGEVPDTNPKKIALVKRKIALMDMVPGYIEKEVQSAGGPTSDTQRQTAQVLNKKSKFIDELFNLEWDQKDQQARLEHRRKMLRNSASACDIAQKTPGFDFFLKTMFLNNKVSRAQACLASQVLVAGKDPKAEEISQHPDYVTIEKIESWMKDVLVAMKEVNYNHSYHPLYLQNAVKLALVQSKVTWAKALIELTKVVSDKFKDDREYESDQQAIKELEKQIEARSADMNYTSTKDPSDEREVKELHEHIAAVKQAIQTAKFVAQENNDQKKA